MEMVESSKLLVESVFISVKLLLLSTLELLLPSTLIARPGELFSAISNPDPWTVASIPIDSRGCKSSVSSSESTGRYDTLLSTLRDRLLLCKQKAENEMHMRKKHPIITDGSRKGYTPRETPFNLTSPIGAAAVRPINGPTDMPRRNNTNETIR
jgi:hypothetical protein